MKKALALVTVIALIISFIPAALAVGNEAAVCSALGLLRGDGGDFDAYLQKDASRLTAVYLTVRLMGAEDTALLGGSGSFGDVSGVLWVEGQRILSYVHDNPKLGWQGSGNLLRPFDSLTSRDMYKVMLTCMGYAQGVDFDWSGGGELPDVIEFAMSLGMGGVEDGISLKNSDIAVILYEALTAQMKSGGKTFADYLAALGLLDKEAAVSYGLCNSVSESAYDPNALGSLEIDGLGNRYGFYCALTEAAVSGADYVDVKNFYADGLTFEDFLYAADVLNKTSALPFLPVELLPGEDDRLMLSFPQQYPSEIRIQLFEQYSEAIADCLNTELPADCSETEAALALFFHVTDRVEPSSENSGGFAALTEELSDSLGYAQALRDLYLQSGIEAYVTEGGESYWVTARLGGSYYHFDPYLGRNGGIFAFGMDDESLLSNGKDAGKMGLLKAPVCSSDRFSAFSGGVGASLDLNEGSVYYSVYNNGATHFKYSIEAGTSAQITVEEMPIVG